MLLAYIIKIILTTSLFSSHHQKDEAQGGDDQRDAGNGNAGALHADAIEFQGGEEEQYGEHPQKILQDIVKEIDYTVMALSKHMETAEHIEGAGEH